MKQILIILMIILCSSTVFAIVGHPANQIFPGLFAENGDYSFDGRLGIGTSSPSNFLHINHSLSGGGIIIESDTEDAYFTLDSGNESGDYPSMWFKKRGVNKGQIYVTGDDNLAIYTYNNKDILLNGGNVGIGTTPLTKFDVLIDTDSGIKFDTVSGSSGVLVTSYQGSNNQNVRDINFNVHEFIVETGIPQGTATTEALRVDNAGRITKPLNPAFSAYLDITDYDVTGDGTVVTIKMNNETYDRGNNFNITNGVFVAPVTGIYHFDLKVEVADLTTAMTSSYIYLRTIGSASAGYHYSNQALGFVGPTQMQISADVYMVAGDYTNIVMRVSNGASATADIQGHITTRYSYFTGHLVG